MSKKVERIKWIDGIRGIMILLVMLGHYLLAFTSKDGYIGYGSNYSKEELLKAFFDNLPSSLLFNNSFPLYVIVLLIAFIPAYKFFKEQNEESILRQAKKRYLRFMIPTFLAFVINFILYRLGLLFNVKVGQIMNNVWLQEMMTLYPSFLKLLYEGLILVYVKGSSFISVSWIMGYLFIGSYITYAVLLLFGRLKNRIPVYIGLFIFFFVYDQMYLNFVMGIIAADIIVNKEEKNAKSLNPFVALFLIVFAYLISGIPDVVLPGMLQSYTLSAIGSCIFIVTISQTKSFHKFLENRVLEVISNYSFSAILIHIPVMAFISCGQYLLMSKMGIDKNIIILSIFILAIPVQILAVYLFQKLVFFIQYVVEQKFNKVSN